MKTRTQFTHRLDTWDDASQIIEHLAGIEEFEVAEATYQAAVKAMAESRHHPAPGRARDEAFFVSLCDPQQVGENKSRRAWNLRRLVLAPRGLTGLLNPLSIWHKIISVVFHELFQLYFIPSQGCFDAR